MKEKERKEKESEPRIAYAEFVTMTATEYGKLIKEYGVTAAQRMVDILNAYKGANGKKYKNDYLAILHWVVDRWRQEQPQAGRPSRPSPPPPASAQPAPIAGGKYAAIMAEALTPLSDAERERLKRQLRAEGYQYWGRSWDE